MSCIALSSASTAASIDVIKLLSFVRLARSLSVFLACRREFPSYASTKLPFRFVCTAAADAARFASRRGSFYALPMPLLRSPFLQFRVIKDGNQSSYCVFMGLVSVRDMNMNLMRGALNQ